MISCQNLHKSYPMGRGRKHVLNGLDFQISPGERVGFLGRNGAGKTTLIKLIGGVEMPTSGKIRRNMSVSWPLGFGGGFQGSLTGYDNARFIARIYGHEYAELRDFVEDFTELGRQLKMPIKTYSSGMKARLAFALSLAIEFDCYLIDEVIMVGDTMETDILGAVQMGYRSVLVLSGGTRRADLKKFAYEPDLIVDHIGMIPDSYIFAKMEPALAP